MIYNVDRSSMIS